jgi:1,4-dihydroxy-2-naphthoate octaprenyltransferase
MAIILLFCLFRIKHQTTVFIIFIFFMLPVIIQITRWFRQVLSDTSRANYENAMAINILTSVCMNLFFLLVLFNNYLKWF